MSVFVAKVKKDYEVQSFVDKSHNTLKYDPVSSMWFENDSYVRYLEQSDGSALVVGNFEIMFPPLFLHLFAAGMGWVVVFFFAGFNWSWWLVLPGLVTFTLLWHTKYFFALMFRLGLYNNGYKGDFELLSNGEVLKDVYKD